MSFKRILKQSISLLNADHVQLDHHWNYKDVMSPYHRIYYIDAGEGIIEDNGTSRRLEAGFLYIIPSYTLCNLSCGHFLSQYFVQFFEESPDSSSIFGNAHFVFKVAARDIDVMNFKRLIELNPGRGLDRSDDPKIYEKHSYYLQYQQLNDLQSHSDFLETQGILLQLISRFSAPEQYYKESKNIPVKILDAIRFIAINIHQKLNVQLLADRYNCSCQHFSRLFEQHMGIRPQAYIIQKRIERAKHMMVFGTLALGDIAELSGFESLSSFSKSFKLETGQSPRMYRKENAE